MEINTIPRGPFWYAADVAKAGYRVFPIAPEKKRSSVPGSFYSSTTDPSYIAAWLEEGREHHLIGIATGFASDLVVIEADTPEAYKEMNDRFGEPDATSSKGGHWYFKHPGGGKVVSRVRFKPGLDCKADGGLVVCPPDKNRRWTNGIPDKYALRKLPEDLIQREEVVTSSGQGRCSTAGPVGEEIPNGNRNGALTSLAGTMRRRGMGEAEIFAALEVTNRFRCKPPLPVEEVRRISGSVARYEPASGQPQWVRVVSKNG